MQIIQKSHLMAIKKDTKKTENTDFSFSKTYIAILKYK